MNSSNVFTAWDDDRLVGLVRVLDDQEMLAYVHYVLVHPDYQGRGIASELIKRVKEEYKDFFYIEVMPKKVKMLLFIKNMDLKSWKMVELCKL